ncbi:endosome/lysosome-associated apoptosis and autophagy regulator family member 2 isoform X1 [Spea bombifrons]|uniref:endosome/lysosome-associated apoptosis and autophagy regulator family member 2 isoform X1 n=1 Tax=Spea bombifrons TaxID=233779 RepID=UPI00234B2AC3|nr:endosome/lysosome-associated apoptosis and autophagy regulator family member 2 isoform X1 [Spea bombifrons]
MLAARPTINMGFFSWTGCLAVCFHFILGTAMSAVPQCTEQEYHFEYTECDSTGSRWRVAVPNEGKTCVGLPDPVKGKECTFSCASGEFLDIKTQLCSPCPSGRYSLGTGIKFDEWDTMPHGFSNLATFMETATGFSVNSCDNSSWIPRGNYIESNRDDCTVSLIYAVHLKKAGSVSFDYQYLDNNIFFEFFIQNDQCQETTSSSDKWVKLSENSDWMHHSVSLKSGTNILYWRTTGILMGSKAVKPVLIKNITIEGVAYTSECFPCKPGTFSDAPGSSDCKICPRNTYSQRGAAECIKCNTEKQYSDEGSSKCIDRPPCTSKDLFQIHTPCDSEGKTQIMYKWIEPKICREDVPESIKLPASGKKENCPPCNPGFYSNGTSACSPCALGTYSNGIQECKPCPAGTEPVLGFEYKWWNILPANMKTSCFNVGNSKCDGMNGWEVAGDHVQSGAGGSDNDYLLLNLHISGFKPPNSVTGANGAELGRITFVFETICSADCVLYFMLDVNRKTTSVAESWGGSREKQSYTHIITKNATYMFTWAFQRTNQVLESRRFVNDVVKIYSITATNAVDGVASSCRACALGSQQLSTSSCVPCPAGHFIDKESNMCKECPPNTYLSPHQVYGKEACIPCGPGSRSNKDHSACYSDCFLSHVSENQTLTYNFNNLSSVGTLINGPSFTSKGTKYFHVFNISLCGNQGEKMAVCTDNITDVTAKDMEGESEDYSNFVKTFVCQSTIIPSDSKGFRTALSSQSVSLADEFLGATVNTTLMGISIKPNAFPAPQKIPDVNFFYKSSAATSSCEKGRATVISMRCNPTIPGQGEISVPRECPAGTCDGCSFFFLWETVEACPLCTENDYQKIEGACKKGKQETHYVWNEPKLCKGSSLPEKRVSACESIDIWLKVGAGVGAFTAVLLVALTCYFWKKNQKLEYKYSKLIMTANSKECELPAPDSCAIMEGEDNDDDVVYSNKQSLLGKLKSLATKPHNVYTEVSPWQKVPTANTKIQALMSLPVWQDE